MLRAENIGKNYRKECVLHHVNLNVNSREILGIVGESGCGKSTLARLLCCYERPSEGRILFNERDTGSYRRKDRLEFHRCCQLILQDNLSSLDPTMTIGDTLHEVLKYNTYFSTSERQDKIEACLASFLLKPELLRRIPIQLSGGERQRINICRALLIEPRLLICDEITSSLDVITQYSLLEMLKQINKELGLTMIFISHDINAVKSICNRIMVMHDGTIIEELKKSDGFTYKEKYTKLLFESLPINHPSKRQYLNRHLKDEIFSDTHSVPRNEVKVIS